MKPRYPDHLDRRKLQRFYVSPAFIRRNEPALGAGVSVYVNSDYVRLYVGMRCLVFADDILIAERAGFYEVKRQTGEIRVALGPLDGGLVAADSEGKHGVCIIETALTDVPIRQINPDLLPAKRFGLKSATVVAGANGVTAPTLFTDWWNSAYGMPLAIWIKYVFWWMESLAGQPPAATDFVYGIDLTRPEPGGSTHTILTVCGTGYAGHANGHHAMLPLMSYWQPYTAIDVPVLNWVFRTSIAAANKFPSVGVIAAYLQPGTLGPPVAGGGGGVS